MATATSFVSAPALVRAFPSISPAQAKEIRKLMDPENPRPALEALDRDAGGFGLEYLRAKDDPYAQRGVEFVNFGETTTVTLMYDQLYGRFRLSAWGDLVEQEEDRFA